jgi:hypothetical protein
MRENGRRMSSYESRGSSERTAGGEAGHNGDEEGGYELHGDDDVEVLVVARGFFWWCLEDEETGVQVGRKELE